MRLIEIAHHRDPTGRIWTREACHIPLRPSNSTPGATPIRTWTEIVCSSGFENNESSFTLALLAGALICSSWASSLGASSLRYHHWISRENGETPTARKAHGISMSSPSPTLTSLGTSVNVAYEENTSTANSAVKRNPSNRFTKAYI